MSGSSPTLPNMSSLVLEYINLSMWPTSRIVLVKLHIDEFLKAKRECKNSKKYTRHLADDHHTSYDMNPISAVLVSRDRWTSIYSIVGEREKRTESAQCRYDSREATYTYAAYSITHFAMRSIIRISLKLTINHFAFLGLNIVTQ